MDNEIKFKPITPAPAPNFPAWEVTVTGLGFTSRTVMTKEQLEQWQKERLKPTC